MKTQKLLLSALVALVCMVALAGCEQTSTTSTSGTSTSSGSTTSSSGTSSASTPSTSTSTSTSTSGAISGLDGEEVTVSSSGAKSSGDDSAVSASRSEGSSIAQKVAEVAAKFPTKYPTRGSFPYASGTKAGVLGCANVVSKALKDAGVSVWSLECYSLCSQLKAKGWKKASPPPKAGDVILWGPLRRGGHPHIGIAVKSGNSVKAMNNSSNKRHPVLSSWNHRGVEAIYRKS